MYLRNLFITKLFTGNNHIHEISTNGSHELVVKLENANGTIEYANYSKFSVEDEQHQFLLRVTGYSGTAGKYMSE